MNTDELSKITDRRRLFCNRCGGDTHHVCVWKSEREEFDWGQDADENERFPPFEEHWIYITWQCLGCQSVCIEERYTNSAMQTGSEQYAWESAIFPARTRNHLKPKHFSRLPKQLATIYSESLTAFNSSVRLLCASGLRSLIEGICRDKDIKGHTIEQLIDGLGTILPQNIVTNLHGLRFMANTAVHELSPPEPDDLRVAIDICEDLLNFLYELDYKTARLGHFMKAQRAPPGHQQGTG